MQVKRYWTNAETAAFMGLRPQTLRQKRHRGDGPPYHRLGDGSRARAAYDPDEVRAWYEARKFQSTSEETVRMAEREDAASGVGFACHAPSRFPRGASSTVATSATGGSTVRCGNQVPDGEVA